MADNRTPGTDSITVIGPDCSIKGEMAFEGSMKFEGKFEGKITSKGRLGLGKGAQITADVTASQVSVDGTFKGNITATERIELASTANILGDVRATKLVIAEGATFVGNCHVAPDALKGVNQNEFVVPIAATPIKGESAGKK